MTYAILSDNTITAYGPAFDLWPDTSFSIDGPNSDFLTEVGAVQIRSDAPYDQATQILQPCEPYLRDGEVFNTVAAPLPPPPPPAPDWSRFKRIAMRSSTLNQILTAAYQSVPIASGSLVPSLLRAEQGDIGDFATAWGVIRRAAAVPPDAISGFVTVATACNLPPEFIAALQPPLK